jgi:hypothetical protein
MHVNQHFLVLLDFGLGDIPSLPNDADVVFDEDSIGARSEAGSFFSRAFGLRQNLALDGLSFVSCYTGHSAV